LDRITLKSLTFHEKHGYYEKERIEGNRFEVDVVAYGEFKESADGDDLKRTFDYQQAEQIVTGVMKGEPKKLIETLCMNIGERIFRETPAVERLVVSVRKLSPPLSTKTAYAEITLEWNR